MKNELYDQYVKMGRDCLNDINSKQALIAYYATIVCTIKHGGHTDSKTYTLSKYAADIGMKLKTLSDWVLIYKNVIAKMSIPADKVTKKEWTVANRVQQLLNQEKRTKQALSGLPRKKTKGVKVDASPERVKDLFKRSYDKKDFQREIYTWNDYVLNIKNALVSKNLSSVELNSLISLKENLDKASDVILRHITTKNKK